MGDSPFLWTDIIEQERRAAAPQRYRRFVFVVFLSPDSLCFRIPAPSAVCGMVAP